VTQNIDMRFRDKVESNPVNIRFRDISGPCVLTGFRSIKGTAAFAITLSKDGFSHSVAISPSGSRVSEDTDLVNIVSVAPNTDVSVSRVDSIYLVYVYGTHEAVASYIVVPGQAGTSVPGANPNPLTHLLLGYIHVPPNSVDLVFNECFEPVKYGFSKLNVAGESRFYETVVFDKPVTFNGLVTFEDGTSSGGGSGGGGGPSSAIARMQNPIIAAVGQTQFNLPSKYTPGTNSLFVFVDWVLQSPDIYLELNDTTISFYEALKGGEKVWAFWFQSLTLYQVAPHNHDDLYYTKQQIDTKSIHYFQDFMAGITGRILVHDIGNAAGYVILGITPTTRSTDVGDISVDKRANDIIVYNTGSYTGAFELSYILKT
jgi:hypothetical protein